jgi:hypothetical protein
MKFAALLALAVCALVATQVRAFPGFARETKLACAGCHTNPAGGAALNDAGKAFKADHAKAPAAGDTKADEYLGANKCKMCHVKEHKAWGETEHAKAVESLQKASPEEVKKFADLLKVEIKGSAAETEACLVCHTTGMNLPGGYPGADSTAKANLAMVGCESCHGPGSAHKAAAKEAKKAAINGAVTEAMCKHCHTPEMSPKFDFAEYKKKGVHHVAAEAAK